MFMFMYISTYIRDYVFQLRYKDNLLCLIIWKTWQRHGIVFDFIFLHAHPSAVHWYVNPIRFSFDYTAYYTLETLSIRQM